MTTVVRGRRAGLVTVLVGAATVGVGIAAATAITPNIGGPGVCNRNTAGAPSMEFELRDATDLHARIPGLGLTPELDAVSGPVEVVVFNGPHLAVPVFGGLDPTGRARPVFDNVVCVVDAHGTPNYYFDVNTTGMSLDGVQVDRRD
jgi:hypothetical protein